MARRVDDDRIRSIIGEVEKPSFVWQQQFDGFGETLHKLARCDWNAVPEPDLWEYFNDLAYVEHLQPELFRHLFPSCVKYWYDTLLDNRTAEAGSAEFHLALHRGRIIGRMLDDQQRSRLYDIFVDGLLDRIDAEDGSWFGSRSAAGHSAIWRFNSLGYIAPLTDLIWQRWWTLDSRGKCITAVMYASGLIYIDADNPIYPEWTPQKGGGGPYLTESDCTIYDAGWLPENIAALENTLTVDFILDRLRVAAGRLADDPVAATASRIAADAQQRREIIEIRISDLLSEMGRPALDHARW